MMHMTGFHFWIKRILHKSSLQMAKSLHFLIFNNLYYLIQTNNVTLHQLLPQISWALVLFLTGIVN